MKLIIETTEKTRIGDVQNAYNDAMKTTNIDSFMRSLQENIGESIVGRGGNHIFISEENGERIAIITPIFNN